MISPDKNLERIIKWAEKVAMYSQSDPETALLHARRTSEAICKDVYEEKTGNISQEITFNNLVESLQKQKLIPKKIVHTLRVIQNFGNFTAHADDDISESIILAINFFPNILDWYFQENKEMQVPNEVRFRKLPLEDLVPLPNLSHAYCVFGYETDGGRESELWQNPFRFHELFSRSGKDFRLRFDEWLKMKRKFSIDEILNGNWVKVADHGHQHRLQFFEEGTLREWSLFSFDENDFWTGTWKLEDGVLKTHIKGYEEVEGENRRDEVGYDLEAIASRNGFHSAVENRNNERNAYFRLIHVGQ